MKNLFLILLCLVSFNSFAKEDAAPKAVEPTGKVFFANLKDGQTISQDFKVQFGLEGMTVKKAGDAEDKKSGHHHLLINQDAIASGQVIPADENHLHFGQAQTEAQLKLKPGTYKLTLQFADGAHRSYGEKLSATVKVTVK